MNEFDNLRPEDFTGNARMAGIPTGSADTFDGFVESCKFALRNAVVLNQGLPIPMIVIATRQDTWPLPSPGGTLRTTLPWIREQVKERGAYWFFMAIEAEVGWYHASIADPIDSGDKATNAASDPVPGVFYYAAERHGAWFQRRQGCARFTGKDLSPLRDAPPEQPTEHFDTVMA